MIYQLITDRETNMQFCFSHALTAIQNEK